MNEREQRIVVETDRYRLTGTVRLPVEGYASRLTDHLNASGREFLALTDVEVVPLDGGADPAGATTRHDYVALGRRHIVFATSAEGGAGSA
jgi:20S proteasome alpha/beta subunit